MDGGHLDRVRDDPALRATLEVARAWGVPPSRFLGLDPTVELRSAPSGGWRVVRAPEWTEEDRNLAMALAVYESDLCPGCRQPLSETTQADREGRYVPAQPIRCHRCTAASIGAESYADSPHASALLMPVEFVGSSAEQQRPEGADDDAADGGEQEHAAALDEQRHG